MLQISLQGICNSCIFASLNNNLNIFKMIPIQTEGLKLTKAQQEIVNMLNDGFRVKEINTHHASGGQWVWFKNDRVHYNYSGKIYRAYCNVSRILKDHSGINIFELIIRPS